MWCMQHINRRSRARDCDGEQEAMAHSTKIANEVVFRNVDRALTPSTLT